MMSPNDVPAICDCDRPPETPSELAPFYVNDDGLRSKDLAGNGGRIASEYEPSREVHTSLTENCRSLCSVLAARFVFMFRFGSGFTRSRSAFEVRGSRFPPTFREPAQESAPYEHEHEREPRSVNREM